jgi:hypothetical protein
MIWTCNNLIVMHGMEVKLYLAVETSTALEVVLLE